MHTRQLVFLVGIAVVSTACSGATPPAAASTPRPAVTALVSPAALPSAAPSSEPSPTAMAQDVQTVGDVKGDAVMIDGAMAPGYLDMLGASVELRDGAFVFTQSLASGVPPAPQLPAGVAALGWSFCVDLDPMQSLRGYPMNAARMPCEVIVQTRWDGAAFQGLVFDRRPLADGNEALTTTLTPATDESAVAETVLSGILGGPATFGWSAFTEELGPLGTDTVHHVDAAPDGGASRSVTWPAK